jgi:biopolymer transport protein ExbD
VVSQPSGGTASGQAKSAYYVSLNAWPLVGVMVTLLFMLMVHTPEPHHNFWWSELDRPRTLHALLQPGALREDAMQVSVTRDGMVYFRHHAVARNELADLGRSALRERAENKAYLPWIAVPNTVTPQQSWTSFGSRA